MWHEAAHAPAARSRTALQPAGFGAAALSWHCSRASLQPVMFVEPPSRSGREDMPSDCASPGPAQGADNPHPSGQIRLPVALERPRGSWQPGLHPQSASEDLRSQFRAVARGVQGRGDCASLDAGSNSAMACSIMFDRPLVPPAPEGPGAPAQPLQHQQQHEQPAWGQDDAWLEQRQSSAVADAAYSLLEDTGSAPRRDFAASSPNAGGDAMSRIRGMRSPALRAADPLGAGPAGNVTLGPGAKTWEHAALAAVQALPTGPVQGRLPIAAPVTPEGWVQWSPLGKVTGPNPLQPAAVHPLPRPVQAWGQPSDDGSSLSSAQLRMRSRLSTTHTSSSGGSTASSASGSCSDEEFPAELLANPPPWHIPNEASRHKLLKGC